MSSVAAELKSNFIYSWCQSDIDRLLNMIEYLTYTHECDEIILSARRSTFSYVQEYIKRYPLLLSMSFEDMKAGITTWSHYAGNGMEKMIQLYERIKDMREASFAEYIENSSIGEDADAAISYEYFDKLLNYHQWPLTERLSELSKLASKHTKAAPRNVTDDEL
jgi:hypothetical protein